VTQLPWASLVAGDLFLLATAPPADSGLFCVNAVTRDRLTLTESHPDMDHKSYDGWSSGRMAKSENERGRIRLTSAGPVS
jgi:hypothetical protein